MNRSRALLLVLISFGAFALSVPEALAKQFRFVGQHPIAKGAGYCYIEAPHVHVYGPAQADVLYRDHDGWEYYVGDPVAYGYDGPKHAYHGAHPVHVDVVVEDPEYVDGRHDVEFCYIAGPHYHAYVPPPEVKFVAKADVYWYMGDFPPEFVAQRPRFARINAVYRPIEYARPVITVEPPPAYVDVLIVVPVPEVSAGAVIAPGVRAGGGLRLDVEIPVPIVEVRVGGGMGIGGGWVRGSGHGHGRKIEHGHGRSRGWRR